MKDKLVFGYASAIFVLSSFVVLAGFSGCHSRHTLFNKISSARSGIHFNNTVVENDSINPIDMEFLYNGGGVAVGDFNNDGLPDLYFTASTTSNKLYLNKGDFDFEDITEIAGVTGEKEWTNAASVIDINGDGFQDIYVCTTVKKDARQRRNLLYVNQGLNSEKVPVFRELAAEYGLADTSFSVHAAFFDYDNDGDEDMYLVTTRLAKRDAAVFSDNKVDTSNTDKDKLFRNDWNDSLHHPVFLDVSAQTGIVEPGYGLGIATADINKDGFKDIYVTNDFFGSDHLYINNGNGTFTNKVREYFKHTAQNAMGNDIADINNDGLADIVSVDMNPEDSYRKKKNMSGNNYYIYQNMVYENTMLQYVRNTLQLNMGPRMKSNDSIGDPVFSDIGFYSGVAETDWSWTPSVADFDNDGLRDLIITNGYPRDVTDHDFGAFRSHASPTTSKAELIDQIPQIKIPNYAYRNAGNLKLENVTDAWGMDEPCFSNGAVYADLDMDGDVDYVINNINEAAFVYENTTNTKTTVTANYLTVQFKGNTPNLNGLGAWAEIYYNGTQQVYENSPYRGYLSTVDTKAFFGLGKTALIDSVIIRWRNKKQVLLNVKANQVLIVEEKNATATDTWEAPTVKSNTLFTNVTTSTGLNYRHMEYDFIDFNNERLLPHKLSQYGPGLAAGDVDGNGLEDIFIGGAGEYEGKFFLQQTGEKFITKDLPPLSGRGVRKPENMGVLLFDADNDGDLDLYCASGSNEFLVNTKNYQDRLYVNDGVGNYVLDTLALPSNYTSKSCVKAADIDNDGDLDLFVGGRVLPGKYPLPVSSFIYRNDSKPGEIKFTDITPEAAKGLLTIGMVCDGVWTDFDNDGFIDLIVVGEWMPVRFFKNDHGKLQDVSARSGIYSETGWWNSIAAGDFDNDGDIDYVVGNMGENSFYRTSPKYPVSIYAKDIDKNGSLDAIPTIFLKDQQNHLREYTAHNRDDIVEQLPYLKKKFLTYKQFANADFAGLFTQTEMEDALVLHANNFKSCFIQNKGNGLFEMKFLPPLAQLAPLYGMVVDDFNEDGNLDVAINGNDFGTEVVTGRYDALNGLLLLGDGHGNFKIQTILQSGLYIPGDGKALIRLRGSDSSCLLAASQNQGPLKFFRRRKKIKTILPLSTDRSLLLTMNDGRIRKQEIYVGSSFLSQSSPFVVIGQQVRRIEIVNVKGAKRTVDLVAQ